jgi:hypothetical protein
MEDKILADKRTYFYLVDGGFFKTSLFDFFNVFDVTALRRCVRLR